MRLPVGDWLTFYLTLFDVDVVIKPTWMKHGEKVTHSIC